eukprot:11998076-Karenia_brevis.AAC.1
MADAIAKRAAKHDDHKAHAAWMSWIREGPAQGLRRQHRMSRVAHGWIPSAVGKVADVKPMDTEIVDPQDSIIEDEHGKIGNGILEAPLSSQDVLDIEADKWATEWLASAPVEPLQCRAFHRGASEHDC